MWKLNLSWKWKLSWKWSWEWKSPRELLKFSLCGLIALESESDPTSEIGFEIYDDIEEEYGNDINEEEESDEINDIGFANNHSFSLKQN